mmetsp:Transcript_21723/g.10156  ORF Transcript_21723/g.10156 Transcript_21723/m.10156 type:complete len:114 (-) Transcript_21723:2127-2468(-)
MTELIVKHISAKNWWQRSRWELFKPLDIIGYTVSAGFITDGATTPRMLWCLFPPMGRYAKAAVLHDFILKENPRDIADKEFLKCLLTLSVPRWRAYIMYAGVRVFSIWKRFIA